MGRATARAPAGSPLATSSSAMATVQGLRVSAADALARAAVMDDLVKAADPNAGDRVDSVPPVVRPWPAA
jgi:hypothetical protein